MIDHASENTISFVYGWALKTSDGRYELHWHTTHTDNSRQEVCEKCGTLYYEKKPCSCKDDSSYMVVSSLAEAEKWLNDKPQLPIEMKGIQI